MKNDKIYSNLLEHILMAHEVYKKASNKIHSEEMSKELETQAKRNKLLFETILNQFDLKQSDVKMSLREKLTVYMEKTLMEIDDILIRLNQKEVLGYCIKREEEIISTLDDLIASNEIDSNDQKVLQSHKSEIQDVLESFKSTKAKYLEKYQETIK